jgi:hypothetical protein
MLRKIGWDRVDWMKLDQDRGLVAGSCDHSNEPSGSVKGGKFLD